MPKKVSIPLFLVMLCLVSTIAQAMPVEPLPPITSGAKQVQPRLGVNNAVGSGPPVCDGRTHQSWWSAGWKISTCFQHVPMLTWGVGTMETSRVIQTVTRNDHHYWLVYNECEHEGQCDATPEEAARYYHDTVVPFIYGLDPEAKLIVGGVNASRCGMQWLERFVTYYRQEYKEDVPRVGWSFHVYPEIWAGTNCDQPWQWNWARTMSTSDIIHYWIQDAEAMRVFVLQYGKTGDEVWITETSCLAPAPAQCQQSIVVLAEAIIDWLNTNGRFVHRVTWFIDHSTGWWKWISLHEPTQHPFDGPPYHLTPVGEVWLNSTLLPVEPITVYYRRFPILAYAADPIPPRPTPSPPLGYP